MFREQYADVFSGDDRWKNAAGADRRSLRVGARLDLHPQPAVLRGHHAGDRRRCATSPARACSRCSATASRPITSRRPARSRRTARPGKYLMAHGVQPADFNSYGARRGNHEVMMRGTFANIRLRNQLAPGTEGGWTTLSAGRRGDDDLRRGDEVQGRGRAAARPRRQGIRIRIVARLGGEGHAAARRRAR